jgi:hypothetical protein
MVSGRFQSILFAVPALRNGYCESILAGLNEQPSGAHPKFGGSGKLPPAEHNTEFGIFFIADPEVRLSHSFHSISPG